MGGEKTEKATAKKRGDARKQGQVLQSTEVTTAFCCIVMFSLMVIIWPWFTERLADVFSEYLGSQAIAPLVGEVDPSTFSKEVLPRVLMSLLGVLFPIFLTAMISGVAINFLQIGFLFTTTPLKFKLSHINLISGFKRMLSLKSLVELLKSVIKILILGYVAYSDYRVMLLEFPSLLGQPVASTAIGFMKNAFSLALKMSAVLVIIAALDYLYQWWKYEKDLKMTKQEVKDEYKNIEGDPQIKSRIRSKQRQMSAMRMMSKVPEADVVITNPTHYAVALKYDEGMGSAPIVIAKGADYIARRIKEIAIENKIQIVENKPLAQALYSMCEVDDEIPPDFYQAVADILVFVYKQKQNRR